MSKAFKNKSPGGPVQRIRKNPELQATARGPTIQDERLIAKRDKQIEYFAYLNEGKPITFAQNDQQINQGQQTNDTSRIHYYTMTTPNDKPVYEHTLRARCQSQLDDPSKAKLLRLQDIEQLQKSENAHELSMVQRNGLWQKALRNASYDKNLDKFDFKADPPPPRLPTSLAY